LRVGFLFRFAETKTPMSNKQQTAVDIAFEKLTNQGLLVTRDYKNLVVYREAKEMEKEQIIDAHLTGLIYPLEMEATKQAKQYYNQTYKSE